MCLKVVRSSQTHHQDALFKALMHALRRRMQQIAELTAQVPGCRAVNRDQCVLQDVLYLCKRTSFVCAATCYDGR